MLKFWIFWSTWLTKIQELIKVFKLIYIVKEDFLIFQKMYDFIVFAFPMITGMPKNHRFVLGQQIESQMLEILDLLTEVNKLDIKDRGKYFVKFSGLFDSMRVKIRLSKDLVLITVKQYLNLMEKHNEIIALIYG